MNRITRIKASLVLAVVAGLTGGTIAAPAVANTLLPPTPTVTVTESTKCGVPDKVTVTTRATTRGVATVEVLNAATYQAIDYTSGVGFEENGPVVVLVDGAIRTRGWTLIDGTQSKYHDATAEECIYSIPRPPAATFTATSMTSPALTVGTPIPKTTTPPSISYVRPLNCNEVGTFTVNASATTVAQNNIQVVNVDTTVQVDGWTIGKPFTYDGTVILVATPKVGFTYTRNVDPERDGYFSGLGFIGRCQVA